MTAPTGLRGRSTAGVTATDAAAGPSPLLDGRVALVTGGARGLGAAICEVLSEAGARVLVADVDAALAAGTAERLKAGGRDALAIDLDVRDADQAAEAVQSAIGAFGALDILVNNAGTDRTAAFEELSIEDWDRVLSVNLRGPIVMSRAALPYLRQSDRGHIVSIASTAAKRAWENASAYHASKWGLLGFSHALHTEARRVGVKVTAVIAGGMRTPFLLDRFPDLDPGLLQDPRNVAEAVRFVLEQPAETVIPEITVLPMRETSWP